MKDKLDMNGKFHKIFGKITLISIFIGIIGYIWFRIADPSPYDDIYYNFLFGLAAFPWFFIPSYLIYRFVRYCYLHQDQEMIKKKEEQEQLIIDFEYQQAVASQKLTEPWAKRYELSACPHCGHYKVREANWDDKRISVAFLGAASNKIGKSYVCDHCERMW